MPGKKKSAKKKAVRRMGGGMMGPKKKMARGGAMKKRGGGMMEKMMGGGMMGPKKKMAKGGKVKGAAASRALERLRKLKGSLGRSQRKTLADLMPKGRDAAAKKAAGKSKRTATLIGKLRQGKGNPAGKDMSLMGKLRSRTLAKLKRARAKK